jgi:hypothetical protein
MAMPPKATYGDIKAYLDKIEKDEIPLLGLPPLSCLSLRIQVFQASRLPEAWVSEKLGTLLTRDTNVKSY